MTETEHLTKAQHDAGFLVDALRSALRVAGQVDSIILLQMIQQASVLAREIQAFSEAKKGDAE